MGAVTKYNTMKKLILCMLAIGFIGQGFAQDPEVIALSEVIITPVNYKYLNQADSKDAAIPVKMLQRKVATFDVQEQDYYTDEYDFYTVSFFIPDGKIVAVYSPDGDIMRTIEKFNDVALPEAVGKAIYERFPNWEVVSDFYKVTYNNKKGANKTYKVKLQNGDKSMKLKLTEDGKFL